MNIIVYERFTTRHTTQRKVTHRHTTQRIVTRNTTTNSYKEHNNEQLHNTAHNMEHRGGERVVREGSVKKQNAQSLEEKKQPRKITKKYLFVPVSCA